MMRMKESTGGPCESCGASTAGWANDIGFGPKGGVVLMLEERVAEVVLCRRCAADTARLVVEWLREAGCHAAAREVTR
jgi:hypothetical protein